MPMHRLGELGRRSEPRAPLDCEFRADNGLERPRVAAGAHSQRGRSEAGLLRSHGALCDLKYHAPHGGSVGQVFRAHHHLGNPDQSGRRGRLGRPAASRASRRAIQYGVRQYDRSSRQHGNHAARYDLLPPPDEFDAQLLVGWYTDSSGATAGFQVGADGVIQAPIVAPGDSLHFTEATSINNAGTIVGTYENTTAIGIPRSVATFHAFTRSADGTFTTYDFGAGVSTGFQGINNNGDIVGDFGTSSQVSQGFLLPKGGSPITFGVVGLNTYPQAVNDSDTVVGVYLDGSGNYHGFQWGNTGLLTTFDFPGAVSTHAEGINNAGTISGYFTDASGKTHGFFGPLGLFKEYHLAGNPNTLPRGINDFGTVTGSYADGKGVLHGFVAQLCAADVSNDIHVAQGAVTLDRKTGEYHETVTLKNKGKTAIAGPLHLLFDNLPSGVFPANGRNFSRCTEALTPFVTLRPTGGTLATGSSVSTDVKLVNSPGGTITFTPRVLAGKRP